MAVSSDVGEFTTDIYNYCARFNCFPIFSHEVLKTKARNMVEVTIELPQQDIRVVGKAPQYAMAMAGAALRFKQEAEKYQAQHGNGAIIINDSTSLTASNARKFVDFYKIIHPKAQIKMDVTLPEEKKAFGLPYRCQLYIDGAPIGDAVEMARQKSAEALAYLTAAVTLKEREPNIFPRFLTAWKAGHGDILKPVPPTDLQVDPDCLLRMRRTLVSARQAGLPDEADELVPDEVGVETNRYRRLPPLTHFQAKVRSLLMQKAFAAYLQDARLVELRRKRAELPVNQHSARVLDLINNNTYSIIVGATGSGKTTQVPQIILENAISKGEGAACNIICTQPRRIAATSVARRVSEERNEELQESVGYHVRFLAKPPKASGSITFCTTGILLKQLQHSPDTIMEDISHLIIDEVHERDIQIDFLLVILKKIMRQRAATGRSTPKVVLMSATMNTELFASYFSNTTAEGDQVGCPAINVPGRNFPVTEKFLDDIMEEIRRAHPASAIRIIKDERASVEFFEANKKFLLGQPNSNAVSASNAANDGDLIIDWKQEKKYSSEGKLVDAADERDDALVPYGLVAGTVAHIASQSREGAVLVFLPGLDEIVKVEETLRRGRIFGIDFNDESKFKIFKLHSSIPGAQTEVFDAVPHGCRKIILSTNIAETSITIPDVHYVVDTGKLREKQYDQARRITQLKCTWISKSNSKQRAGRAGRVQNGHYYALFPKERYNAMRDITLPEMLRSDLQEICLDVKAQAFESPIREFLAAAIEPPSPEAVDISIKNLEALDALTPEERITPLGRLLASLPVHPSLGKMIVLGVIFRCLDPMVILGAADVERSLFVRPEGVTRAQSFRKKLSFAQDTASDHIAVLNAVRAMREQGLRGPQTQWEFAMQNFIHINAYKTIERTAHQIEDILIEAGIIPRAPPTPGRHFEIGSRSLNQNSTKVPLIKGLLLAGLHPNLAFCKGGRFYRTPGQQDTMPHPNSVNTPEGRRKGEMGETGEKEEKGERSPTNRFGELLSYSSMQRSNDDSRTFLCETTQSTPLMAVLFGGKISTDFHRKLIVDSWLSYNVRSADIMAVKTIFEFRKALERLLSMTFRNLTIMKDGRKLAGLSSADEVVREMFATGLVEVLDSVDGDFEGEDWSSAPGYNSSQGPPAWAREPRDVAEVDRWGLRKSRSYSQSNTSGSVTGRNRWSVGVNQW